MEIPQRRCKSIQTNTARNRQLSITCFTKNVSSTYTVFERLAAVQIGADAVGSAHSIQQTSQSTNSVTDQCGMVFRQTSRAAKLYLMHALYIIAVISRHSATDRRNARWCRSPPTPVSCCGSFVQCDAWLHYYQHHTLHADLSKSP
jgi:hypothetical protein